MFHIDDPCTHGHDHHGRTCLVHAVALMLRAENNGQHATVHLGPFTTYVLIAALQQALASSPADPATTATVRAVGRRLTALFPAHTQALFGDTWNTHPTWPLPHTADGTTAACPACPVCGQPPAMVLDRTAMCPTPDCQVTSWDVTRPAADLLAQPHTLKGTR